MCFLKPFKQLQSVANNFFIFLADAPVHCSDDIFNYCSNALQQLALDAKVPPSANALEGMFIKIWSALQLQSGVPSFEWSRWVIVREDSKMSGAIVAAVDQAFWLLHKRVLSKMLLVSENGEPIPGTQESFEQLFGWSSAIDGIFNPNVNKPHNNKAAKAAFEKARWRVLDGLAERGLAVRMSSAHHHAPSQVVSRASRRPAPTPTRPFPIDIFFGIAVIGAMIAFE
jgi:hypothetical protein